MSTLFERAILLDVCLGTALGSRLFSAPRTTEPGPSTLFLDGSQLIWLRDLQRDGDAGATAVARAVREYADAVLHLPLVSVTDKPEPGPSGDLHDYYSVGRYWWPRPDTADGLPYVLKDGIPNPEGFSDRYDAARLRSFSDRVGILGLASVLLEDSSYGSRGAEMLRHWFISPETRQAPHFSYAQVVPGRKVRSGSLVEGRHLIYVTEAIRLLEYCGQLSSSERSQLRRWFVELRDWMDRSAAGESAARANNNIGLWFDLQAVTYAHFTGDETGAARIARLSLPQRLRTQADAKGGLRAEVAREDPEHYMAFSVAALLGLSRAAGVLGADPWAESADLTTLQATFDWIARVTLPTGVRDDLLRVFDAKFVNVSEPAQRQFEVSAAVQMALTLRALQRGVREAEEATAGLKSQLAALRAQLSQVEAEREELLVNRRRRPFDLRGRAVLSRVIHRVRRQRLIGAGWRIAGRAKRRSVALLDSGRADERPCISETGEKESPKRRRRREETPTDSELVDRYRSTGLHEVPDSFALYRIIGNDLPPRHRPGQSRSNVEFILENEPDLLGCDKRWVINRIIDPEEERKIIELLEGCSQPYVRIPFLLDEYAQVDWDFEHWCSGVGRAKSDRDPYARVRLLAHSYRLKNNYAMHNNGARNAALSDGRGRAKWILPWDGNCYVSVEGWERMRNAIAAAPHISYWCVPMARVAKNSLLLRGEAGKEFNEEPQLVFRCDTTEVFNPELPYGRRPKVELLWRLGVPGPWDDWRYDPWDKRFRPRPRSTFGVGRAGWVARLESGQRELEEADEASFQARGQARALGIVNVLEGLDARVMKGEAERRTLLVSYSEEVIREFRELRLVSLGAREVLMELAERADKALQRGPYSVVDKTTHPPSGDPHDYWHPAPYWWPNPASRTGLPYVHRDGERVPGTQLYEHGSEQFDRTRLQCLLDDVAILSLQWLVSGEDRYAEHASRLVYTWFINPRTSMNPHLRYAQVRRGHNSDQGASTGIIEFKDVYYFLDAVVLLERGGAITAPDGAALRTWFSDYIAWLSASAQGIEERDAPNNHGVLYDLQVGRIALFLEDFTSLAQTVRRSHGRVLQHFDEEGRQPAELVRTNSAHYCCFNLQSWINMADLADRCGSNLWGRSCPDGRGLERGIEWLLRRSGAADDDWQYKQIDPFDAGRLAPLAYAFQDAYGKESPEGESWALPRVKPVYFPHDGVAPFWCFGRRSTIDKVKQGR